jgi:dual specificity tyrosine-phosphorylation-regulated kinase 2/3/4
MNSTKNSPIYRAIKLRSLNKRTIKKKSVLINPKTSKPDASILRSSLKIETSSPKYYYSSRHSVDSNLPMLSEKEVLNTSMNLFTNNYLKSSGGMNRTQALQPSEIFTPQNLTDIGEIIRIREDVKSARLRSRQSKEKSNSHTNLDPDSMLSNQQLPLKPALVFKQFLNFITKYEQAEILDYSEIYYIGMNSLKIKGDSNQDNYGFDDERNDYKLTIGDHIAYRYEIQQTLGKGSFGQVCKCYDHKNKKHVALKIIRNQKRFHRQAKIEIKVLQHMKNNDKDSYSHAIQMQEYFVFRKHICITFELLSINLYELLKSNHFRGFSLPLVKRFIVQIAACLSFMRQNKIIHCDLKPENILLKEPNKSGIKVIDFGSSCFDNEKVYTYIQSRFYRAPEIILGIDYTVAIDMWSLGCIAAEMHSGCPLFPGESEAEQLLCIMEIKGLPPPEILEISTRKKIFFDGNNPKIISNSRGKKRIPGTKKIEEKVRSTDKDFLNFLERCLDWNPGTRMTPEEAFNHEFIQEGLRSYERSTKISNSKCDT